MSVGYACKLLGVEGTDFRSCNARSVNESLLTDIIKHNLKTLDNIIEYNIKNRIKLYRISSDLVPFGSSDLNNIKWWEIFREDFDETGRKIKDNNIRVSLHPGQYTVLNSPDSEIVKRAEKDLIYHCRILDLLGLDYTHKIILHIGGAYNNKEKAVKRFSENYNSLPENVKKRVVIENDDRSYNIEEVLSIGFNNHIPVVFDNLHHEILKPDNNYSENHWIEKASLTWKSEDGKQKIHYSQQAEGKRKGSHSDYIGIKSFIDFYNKNNCNLLDVMLEVKDKNLSCIKCLNATTNVKKNSFEKEWSLYKYNILEHSHKIYLEIRKLLRENNEIDALIFYSLLEKGFSTPKDMGSQMNALLHVWGYFKNVADEKEKNKFFMLQENFKNNRCNIKNLKSFLKKLTIKYEEQYLIDSYYFEELY